MMSAPTAPFSANSSANPASTSAAGPAAGPTIKPAAPVCASPAGAGTAFSRIPSVDALLRDERVGAAISRYGRQLVVDTLREVLADLRANTGKNAPAIDAAAIIDDLSARVARVAGSSLRRVFNLTGTVLHTNLGRAPLPPEAVRAVAQAMEHACTLEYDLDQGGRGERDDHLEPLICRLTGAEAATVVNNNAAAVLLTLNSLAFGKEVVVSRGELVEIGGAFRIPDVMERAGCKLREVGTTNRTHLRDYANAAGDATGALMKVHTSNYTVVGFTHSVSEQQLAQVARDKGVPLISDLGSGSLIDMAAYGLPHEPTPRDAIAHGVDIVTFSGDKLLGGPQCGIVAGRRDLVALIRRNPLKRALRLDKMSIAALQAVLALYLDPATLRERLPALRMLSRPAADIQACAARMQAALAGFFSGMATVEIAPCQSQIGSGSLPVDVLPSFALRIAPLRSVPPRGAVQSATRGDTGALPVQALADLLRRLPLPVLGRIHDDAVWLDLRCLEDESAFLAQLSASRQAPAP